MTAIATFDKSNKPLVKVDFTGTNISEEGYLEFINNWNQCDEEKEDYNYFFDVSKGMGSPSIKYAFGIAGFIMRKKKEPTIYLKYSIIYVTSSSARTLLRLVFNISAPIAPVYITTKLETVEILNTYIPTYRENHNKFPTIIPNDDVLIFVP
tara:strand:+ start:1178 stop:1633 length:456 start_codon:yes stop_codon:yes gene_type:complete